MLCPGHQVGGIEGCEMDRQPSIKHLAGCDGVDIDIPFCYLILYGRPFAFDVSGHIQCTAHCMHSRDFGCDLRIKPQRLGEIGVWAADEHRDRAGRFIQDFDDQLSRLE